MSEVEERRDYYMVLGAVADDSRDEIERRYKRLAVEHHPDRGGDEERMKAINEAWGVLKDEATRESYDASRRHRSSSSCDISPEFVPAHSPASQADAIGGRLAGSLLSAFAGVVLVILVRFHYVMFLWPLALLGLSPLLFSM